jgi:hypothetical protein
MAVMESSAQSLEGKCPKKGSFSWHYMGKQCSGEGAGSAVKPGTAKELRDLAAPDAARSPNPLISSIPTWDSQGLPPLPMSLLCDIIVCQAPSPPSPCLSPLFMRCAAPSVVREK